MNVFRKSMNSFWNGMNMFQTGMKTFRIGTGIQGNQNYQKKWNFSGSKNWKIFFKIQIFNIWFGLVWALVLVSLISSTTYPECFHCSLEHIHSVLEWIHTDPEYIHSGSTFLIVSIYFLLVNMNCPREPVLHPLPRCGEVRMECSVWCDANGGRAGDGGGGRVSCSCWHKRAASFLSIFVSNYFVFKIKQGIQSMNRFAIC